MPEATFSAAARTAAWLGWLSLAAGTTALPRQLAADGPGSPELLGRAADETAGIRETAADAEALRRLLDDYRDSLEIGQYQEAENAAKQRIEFLFRAADSSDPAMTNALVDLASAQRLNARFDEAIQNYMAAVSLLEQSESVLDEGLIEPLRGLGDTYMAFGRPERALPVYERALHLNHVNAGPHNLDQVEILDAMIEAEMEAARPDAALGVVDRISALHARRFGAGSEEMLPALARRASLLSRLERHQDERLTRLDMVRIIRGHRGDADFSLIEAYTAIGRTYLHEVGEVVFRSEPTGQTGETFLRRAVEVAREGPGAGSLVHSQALIQLADYYTVTNAQDKARQNYRSAWDALSRNEPLLEHRKDLEAPVILIRPKLDRMATFGYRSGDEGAESGRHTEGYMVARFTINERGRVTAIEIVESDPVDFAAMQTRVQRTLRESVYRPRYENGEPVRTENQLFRHEFLYVD